MAQGGDSQRKRKRAVLRLGPILEERERVSLSSYILAIVAAAAASVNSLIDRAHAATSEQCIQQNELHF